jgi:hypothetical protein
MTVAMTGIVVVGAGFGMMLNQPCDRGNRTCTGSDTGWLIGGVTVVGAGVTMTYLGLRMMTVTPVVSPQMIGVVGVIRWKR